MKKDATIKQGKDNSTGETRMKVERGQRMVD